MKGFKRKKGKESLCPLANLRIKCRLHTKFVRLRLSALLKKRYIRVGVYMLVVLFIAALLHPLIYQRYLIHATLNNFIYTLENNRQDIKAGVYHTEFELIESEDLHRYLSLKNSVPFNEFACDGVTSDSVRIWKSDTDITSTCYGATMSTINTTNEGCTVLDPVRNTLEFNGINLTYLEPFVVSYLDDSKILPDILYSHEEDGMFAYYVDYTPSDIDSPDEYHALVYLAPRSGALIKEDLYTKYHGHTFKIRTISIIQTSWHTSADLDDFGHSNCTH